MKTGVFGGTFSPPHRGHLEMAKAAKKQLMLDEILFMPCGTPPHKDEKRVISQIDRFNMTKLLIEDIKDFKISDFEIKNSGKSYSAKTLSALKKAYPQNELYFIVGADSLCYMDEWMKPEIIFKNAEIAAIARSGISAKHLFEYAEFLKEKYGAVIHFVEMENIDISSSLLRDMILHNTDISEYTSDKVYRYIKERELYGYRKD